MPPCSRVWPNFGARSRMSMNPKVHSKASNVGVQTNEAVAPRSKSLAIAAGDLAFLFTECQRCFYDKVRYHVRRPGIFPSFFTVVDRTMKATYGDGAWHEVRRVVRPAAHGIEPLG